MKLLSQIKKTLLYSTTINDDDGKIRREINDTRGHAAGDELIFGTAECLRQGFESVDSIYRIGGDEFCAITECAEDDAARHAVSMAMSALISE